MKKGTYEFVPSFHSKHCKVHKGLRKGFEVHISNSLTHLIKENSLTHWTPLYSLPLALHAKLTLDLKFDKLFLILSYWFGFACQTICRSVGTYVDNMYGTYVGASVYICMDPV